MNSDLLALLGVVVGATLGGGAQLLATNLQDRRRHRQWLREHRAEIYQAFLAEAEQYFSMLDYYYIFEAGRGPEPAEDLLEPLFTRSEDVGLFGTHEAHTLATAAVKSLVHLQDAPSGKVQARTSAASAAIAALRSQARKDLLAYG
ncbi:hypothetical protein [Propionicimonas sp.]|uniref:hypothetical protein n=1 Tax=Propionicimonas sp. TaxID=1955623 RepID=UPI0017FF5A57|nr:hypothetical protein [Propionicimonas sp.]MBU3976766.1 hypothetical protein [Actinomycetota bacterium]MBA3019831.1 hypothetical protein [Propionicimonas sp.]MBU3986861.1 hypothetical protein [Actinomycetota bacterium]MBU4006773.1 hypothetical protein [Actinomycetota bacterium]MBU4065473.1 hypothetical protein [Actinomycetota bacterium]